MDSTQRDPEPSKPSADSGKPESGLPFGPTKLDPKESIKTGDQMSAGLQFGATLILFAGAGWWLDQKLSTSPWLLILMVFLGFAGALVALVKRVE